MINNPKICVAICNYNHENYLHQSIKSIVEQDYENLDIAVIDDGSSSNYSFDIVQQFQDKRIRYKKFDENKGKWFCLNFAFSTTDAEICTSHDADDVSLSWRLSTQLAVMKSTNTLHNMCGFVHCWNEDEIASNLDAGRPSTVSCIPSDEVLKWVSMGYESPGCNHYYTGNFETAGVSSMFLKKIWDIGFRFNPPKQGIRILHSEDSDFNCRLTLGLQSTSILAEKPYLYRRYTSTNKEEI